LFSHTDGRKGMSGVITEYNLFKPKLSRAETKADITNHTSARAIVGAEAEPREAKNARLRQPGWKGNQTGRPGSLCLATPREYRIAAACTVVHVTPDRRAGEISDRYLIIEHRSDWNFLIRCMSP
jgi:hypothetical protein